MTTTRELAPLSPVLDRDEILSLLALVRTITIRPDVMAYAVDIARRSRPQSGIAPEFVTEWVAWGAGPRAAQALVLGGKARALLNGRTEALAEDLRAVANAVFRHRLIPNFQAEADGMRAEDLVERLIAEAPAPDGWQPVRPPRRSFFARLFGRS